MKFWPLATVVAGFLLAPVLTEAFDPFADASALSESEAPKRVEANAWGLFYTRWNSDLQNNAPTEQLHEWRNKVLVGIDVKNAWGWRLNLSGVGRYDLYPNPNGLRAHLKPELWEAYAVLAKSSWELSVGQQIRRWGRGVPSLVDVIVPNDFSELLFIEDEFQKRPIPLARWTKFAESYELELIAIPFYRAAVVPGSNSDWSPITITDLQGAEDIPLVQGALDQGLSPGLITEPQDNLLNGDLGLRWTKYARGFDLDIYLFYGYEDLPAPAFSDGFLDFLRSEAARGRPPLQTLRSLALQEIIAFSPIYSQRPARQLLGGVSFVKPLQIVTARFELSGMDRQSAYTDGLALIRVPSFQALAGFDALSGERFLWTLALLAQAFVTDEELFLINRYNASALGLMRVKLGDLALWLEGRALWNVNLGDAWLGPSLLYDFARGWQVQAGVHLLFGSAASPLGQYDHNDFVFARLRYAF